MFDNSLSKYTQRCLTNAYLQTGPARTKTPAGVASRGGYWPYLVSEWLDLHQGHCGGYGPAVPTLYYVLVLSAPPGYCASWLIGTIFISRLYRQPRSTIYTVKDVWDKKGPRLEQKYITLNKAGANLVNYSLHFPSGKIWCLCNGLFSLLSKKEGNVV